jgi:hypothetical protein
MTTALRTLVKPQSMGVFDRATMFCERLITQCREFLNEYLRSNGLSSDDVCFFAVGSVGRFEALDASDLDLTPVVKSAEARIALQPHDAPIRRQLADKLGLKVSKGQDLTSLVDLPALTRPESIGGEQDDSNALTKRILILTEGRAVGGGFEPEIIRRQVLDAYAGAARTRGRHVLSLCNDVARYYRTLCIEYKAKVDVECKDWATRNAKLRHSRKFWYIATMLAITTLAKNYPDGEGAYVAELLDAFSKPPVQRFAEALGEEQKTVGGLVLECFADYLQIMSNPQTRQQLAEITYETRMNHEVFQRLKASSDKMHEAILGVIDELDANVRRKVLDWFLL